MSSSRAMHADYPLGRGPPMGRLCPGGSLTVARTAASPRLMHRYTVSWVSPCWDWGCGLETTFLVYYYSSGYRGPRPPRPTVPPPTVPPPPRSFLPVGIGEWHHSDMSTSWSEADQRPRPDQPPFLPHCAPDGSHHVLTLVNAPMKGRYTYLYLSLITSLYKVLLNIRVLLNIS